jgi:hypothetical protein
MARHIGELAAVVALGVRTDEAERGWLAPLEAGALMDRMEGRPVQLAEITPAASRRT